MNEDSCVVLGKENYKGRYGKVRYNREKFPEILFWFLLLLYSGVMLYLFLMQCFQVPDFVSDMPDYVNYAAGIKGNYEFPYPLFFMLARVFAIFAGTETGVALAAALLNSLGIIATREYMERTLEPMLGEAGLTDPDKWGKRQRILYDLAVIFAAFALFLLGNLYSPKNTAFFGFDYAYRCMGIYTPNPIWNATYLATRPFAVVCFFEGCRMLLLIGASKDTASNGKTLSEKFPWKESIPFAVSLFLTTITKPSFTMIVVPAMGLVILAQLIRSRGRSFKYAFCLCVTMIPTGLHLIYQFFGVFSGTNVMGEETGIGFAFAKVWSNYSTNIPLSILMGMALPIGVLILNGRELFKNPYYGFAWLNYLAGTGMFLCFYEKGFRMLHANFSWGYMHGMFFVFLMTLMVMLKNTVQWRKSYKVVFVMAEWAVFFYHLFCGINFLVYALQGKELAGF